MPPVCSYVPSMFVCPICLYAPNTLCIQTPPICPQCSPMHLYVVGVSAGDIGMWGPYMLDTSYGGVDAFLCVQHPHACIVCSPVSLCIVGNICRFMGKTLVCWESGGWQHICQAFWCLSVHPWMSIISFCAFLVIDKTTIVH